MVTDILMERCCTTPEQVREAARLGAGRAELCARLHTGGLTPPEEDIREAIGAGIPVNVLIRPREGDFVYSGEEVEEMLAGIDLCRRLGANGVVVGALLEDGSVDLDTMRRLVSRAKAGELASQAKEGGLFSRAKAEGRPPETGGGHCGGRPLEVTFHRAFDECRDPFAALEEIIGLGCDRILTSGQEPSASEGRRLIAQLVEAARGRIIIMPGAGVTPDNIDELKEYTKATEYHGTRLCARQ